MCVTSARFPPHPDLFFFLPSPLVFLDTVLKAVHDMPVPVRDFIRRLFSASEARFPGSGYRSIGAIYFLRFVCPMIVSPKAYQLVKENKELTATSQRGLILIAKVIQSIANESTTFEKEEYMKPLTDFVLKHVASVHAYYDAIIKEETAKPTKNISRSACPPQYLLTIVRFLRRDGEKVRAQLLELGGTDTLWARLLVLVEALSPSKAKPSAAEAKAAAEDPDTVAVAALGSSSASPSTELHSSDDLSVDRHELARSTGPTRSGSATAPPPPPMSPKKGKNEKKEEKKAKQEKHKGKESNAKDAVAAAAAAAKNNASTAAKAAPADSSLSNSANKPHMVRTQSSTNTGESSDSTEDPRSSHSDQFTAP